MKVPAIPTISLHAVPTLNIHYLVLVALTATGVLAAFPLSFFETANVWLGILLVPYALMTDGPRRFNFYYAGLTIVFSILTIRFGVRMFYFFTIAFALLTVVEYAKGRVTLLMLFLLMAMSPFFNQVSGLIGFPIRLALSNWAGTLLYYGGWDVRIDGNVIVMDDISFSVDQACMGLNMLAISMLMTVFLVAAQLRKTKTTLSLTPLSMIFVVTFALNVVANFLRILMLVIFKILPDHPLHELIGLFCLVIYILLPLHHLITWTVKLFGKVSTESLAINTGASKALRRSMYVVALSLAIMGFYTNKKRQDVAMQHAEVTINTANISNQSSFNALQVKKINASVTKVYNDNMLIYIKPIPEFFSGEHSPLFCWQGGGYEFKRIKQVVVNGTAIYLANVVKGDVKLYTAWWYCNGQVKTIDQFDWRMRMMKGESSFNLINVTCESEYALVGIVHELLENQIITVKQES